MLARHFLQTCSRILGLECSPKGIQLDDGSVSVGIGIFPMGINAVALQQRQQQPDVQRMISSLRQKYLGKRIVVGRDKLDATKGVKQKLYAFQRFLSLHPEWVGKVVLIQVKQ